MNEYAAVFHSSEQVVDRDIKRKIGETITAIEAWIDDEQLTDEERDAQTDALVDEAEQYLRAIEDVEVPDGELHQMIEHQMIKEAVEAETEEIKDVMRINYPMTRIDTWPHDVDKFLDEQRGDIEVLDGVTILSNEIADFINQLGESARRYNDDVTIMKRKYMLAARVYGIYGDELGSRLVPAIDIAAGKGLATVADVEPAVVCMRERAENGIASAKLEYIGVITENVIANVRVGVVRSVDHILGADDTGRNERYVEMILSLAALPAIYETLRRYDASSFVSDEMIEQFYKGYELSLSAYDEMIARDNIAPDRAFILDQMIHSVYDDAEQTIIQVVAREGGMQI